MKYITLSVLLASLFNMHSAYAAEEIRMYECLSGDGQSQCIDTRSAEGREIILHDLDSNPSKAFMFRVLEEKIRSVVKTETIQARIKQTLNELVNCRKEARVKLGYPEDASQIQFMPITGIQGADYGIVGFTFAPFIPFTKTPFNKVNLNGCSDAASSEKIACTSIVSQFDDAYNEVHNECSSAGLAKEMIENSGM